MSFTYSVADLSSSTSKIRAIIPDTSSTNYVFEDEELAAFYSLEGDSVKRGAALALETIASNETMVLKVMRLLDVQTDGAKVSDALLKRAERLRSQADDEEAATDAGFDIAEMVVDGFTWQERWAKQQQRLGL